MVVISANAVQSAPVGLAVAISTAAVLAGAALQTSAAIAATKAIAMTTLQKSLIGAALAVAVGTGIYETRKASRLRDKLKTLEQQQAEQSAQFQRERGAAFAQLSALREDYERSKSNSSEMLKLRSEVARLGASQREQANFRWSIARPDAAPAPTSTQPNENELPKDSWADVGFATPQSALRTRGWAVLNGNRERFKESVFITDGARKLMEDKLEKMIASAPEAEKKRFSQQILNDNLGFEEALLRLHRVSDSFAASAVCRRDDSRSGDRDGLCTTEKGNDEVPAFWQRLEGAHRRGLYQSESLDRGDAFAALSLRNSAASRCSSGRRRSGQLPKTRTGTPATTVPPRNFFVRFPSSAGLY